MSTQVAPATEFWKAVHATFDPLEPVTDPALRAERSRYNPMSELDARLRLPIRHMCYGVAGGVGSGKSTELLAACGRLTDDALVVYLDLWRHFEGRVRDPGALDHLQPWELVGLLGLALVRAGSDRFGHNWGDEPKLLATALAKLSSGEDDSPAIDVGKLAGGMAVVAGGALGAAAGVALQALEVVKDSTSWQWKLGSRDRSRTSDQDQRVRDVLDATNAIVGRLTEEYQRKLVLVVDGLDRVVEAATFSDLFVESNLLKELRCDVVVSMDLSLVQRFRSRLRLDQTFELANVPVANAGDPQELGTGVEFFLDLVARRLEALGHPPPAEELSPERVRRLAWCSGGRLRDFMRLVRELAIRGLMKPTDPLDEKDVASVIDAERRDKESGLNKDEIALLQAVYDDPEHRLPGGEVALRLLEKHLLLAYPNESTWYLPHALLTLNLIQTGR